MDASPQTASSFDRQDNLQVVDALRGYAILAVMAAHITPYVKDLVWPARRLLLMGVYGVQLFFVASALTLLMSWARSRDSFGQRSAKFLIRRFFRIAPLYFIAVAFYWLVYQNSAQDFSMDRLLASLLFYNAWSPYLMPTVSGWAPVPGGWSIGVEFSFYFVFPFLALYITSLRRAAVFIVLALVILLAATWFGPHLYPEVGADEKEHFLYFWPPNQLIVFALGFFLYQCVKSASVQQWIARLPITADVATLVCGIAVLALSAYGRFSFFDLSHGILPTHLLISCVFTAWALVMVCKPRGVAINGAIVSLGKVSFSAYILHFAILKWVNHGLEFVFPFSSGVVASAAHALVLLAIGVPLTWCASSLTYNYIEQPFISLGKRLISSFALVSGVQRPE